ncbi:glycosyltransferase [Caulobacter sp. S45]|uniref:glycosyltransferase n=1 Tax=Caulobacter sp. S45 TaxID=1641861 RepID=UPI001575A76A|nr:glycosyltransferase [Caulobacter sp. S45]
MTPAPGILLVSTADWDNPFWTNKQHVAVELARQGRRVLYVESSGLRRPSFRPRDVRRIFRRLARALRAPREVRPGLWVWSPAVLPWHSARTVRRLNRLGLRLGLALSARHAGLAPRVLWTYSPLTPELYDLHRFSQVIYHCVDDIGAQPGMPREAIAQAEAVLVRRADIVFTTAPALRDRHAAAGARRCVFLPNVADADHFGAALAKTTLVPADLAALSAPRIGFVGAVSGYKLDFALIRAVALARPAYSFVLIGQVGEGDPWTDVSPLRGLANLHLMGPRPYAELPAYLAGMDAAMLPGATNTYTAAMFPMKLFEYLAAGLPVVATPLPALAEVADLMLVAPPEADAFAAALDRALAGEGACLEARLAAARAHTYAQRTRDMLARIEALDQPE